MRRSRSSIHAFRPKYIYLLLGLCMAASAHGVLGEELPDSQHEMMLMMSAEVKHTGDPKANRLAENLLNGAVVMAHSVPFAKGHSPMKGLIVSPASNGKPASEQALPARDAAGKPAAKRRYHTHLRIFVPASGIGSLRPPNTTSASRPQGANPPETGQPFNTPASFGCVYNLQSRTVVRPSSACSPDFAALNPSGGGGAIAVVDAFDTPDTVQDLKDFSTQFGLPRADFQIVYATTKRPADSVAEGSGWDVESELDVQWAHAIAPAAKIYLVEAASDSDEDLDNAVEIAAALVQQSGGGEVSMSFGGSEYAGEIAEDAHFRDRPGVVFLASAGDTHMVSYPASSPHVMAVGGTTLVRDAENNFVKEVVWDDAAAGEDDGAGTGGGPSYFEPRPAYQNSVARVVAGTRGTPDISLDASVDSGVWVLAHGYWNPVGGTSLSSPATAAIINVATTLGGTRTFMNTSVELNNIYGQASVSTYPANFHDVTMGSCGQEPFPPAATVASLTAAAGYDLCSGLGVPQGYHGYGSPLGVVPTASLPFVIQGAKTFMTGPVLLQSMPSQ